jgi:uncharacterized protein
MKKEFVLLGFAFILLFSLVGVYSLEGFPSAKNKYVNDFASVLTTEQQGQLISLFGGVEADTTAQVVFVSLNSINGSDISQYATELGQSWGVGQSDVDNGIVILYVLDIKKIYVAIGYGVEGILPDSKVGRLLDENYVPLRDAGNLSLGIVSFSEQIAQVLEDNKEEIKSGKASGNSKSNVDWTYIIFIIIWILIIVMAMKRRYKDSRKNKNKSSFPWWILFFLPSRSSGSGSGFSGGFGGGGGGFGGGGFGGGGAGR